VEFRLLGLLEVIDDDGSAIQLGGRNECALLALLLLDANRPLSADRLIEGLWSERAPPSAMKTVQVYVSRLRRRLPADRVATTAAGYQLRLEPDELDADRFARLAAQGRTLFVGGDADGAVALLSEALELWRGSPLAGFETRDFAREEIRRLEELRTVAIADRVDARLAAGGTGELVGELQELVDVHPLWERPRAQLMLALYRAGRQADALEVYQLARDLLVRELGIEPGKSLRDLQQQILQQAASLDLPSPPASADGRTAFVGRVREMAELVRALEDARRGSGCLFLLVGEPGIGKSRLAEELLDRAALQGAHTLLGRSWEAGGAPVYWPWIQALRPYVRRLGLAELRSQLGPGAAAVAQLLPEVRERLQDLPEPPPLEPEAARFRLFDATAEFLRRASAETPIALVLDDLQAADPASLLLLQFLARGIGSMRMVVVGTVRDVDPLPDAHLTSVLGEIGREPAAQRLALIGLTRDEVSEYVGAAAADIVTPELAGSLHAETDGNPLFLVETVRLLASEGADSAAKAPLPETMRELISRRLQQLPDECTSLLELASVLGREFPLAALAGLAGAQEDDVLDVLESALTTRVVFEVGGAPGRFRFTHVLVRDLLYDRLGAAGRVRAHRAALTVLETLYRPDVEQHLTELAHHAIAGLEPKAILAYSERAGDRALALLANEEAARLYSVALEALPRTDRRNPDARCELLLSLGEAELRAGRSGAAKTAFLEAAAIARRTGSPRTLARAAVGYGGRSMYSRAGSDLELVPLLEEALVQLDHDQDDELRVRLLARLAGALRDQRDRSRRDSLSNEAVALARRSGSPTALAYALDGRAAAMIAPDTIDECLQIADELISVADAAGDKERSFYGRLARLTALVFAGALPRAEADLAAVNRLAVDLRQPQQLFQALGADAMFALGQGRLAEAETLIERAHTYGAGAQPEMAIPIYTLQRYALFELRGDDHDLTSAISDLIIDFPARPVFRCLLAHLRARANRHEDAATDLAELTADAIAALPFDQEWLLGMSLLAEACARVGDTDAAAVLYPPLLPWANLIVADYPEAIRGSVSRYLALLAMQLGLIDDADAHFRHALDVNERMGLRPWLAFTQADYAQMLLARGRAEDGVHARQLLAASDASRRSLGITRTP
jgi:DNA-binding SARP family transcriptional activator